MIDRLYKLQLSLPLGQSNRPLYEAMRKLRWGESLSKVEAFDRALTVWGELGGTPSYPVEQRENALVKAADLEIARGRKAQTLSWLEKAIPLRADNYVFSEKLALKRLELLNQLQRPEQALQVLDALVAHPSISAPRREQFQIEIANRLYKAGKKSEAGELLDSVEQSPERAGATLVDVALTRAQAALDAGNPAEAERTLQTGLDAVIKAKDLQSSAILQKARGQFYRGQKQYLKAMEAFSLVSRDSAGRVAPNQDVVDAVRATLTESIKAGRLSDSAAIVSTVKEWAVHPILMLMMDTEYLAAKGDAAAARAALAQARSQLVYFSGAPRDYLQKELDRLAASIPSP